MRIIHPAALVLLALGATIPGAALAATSANPAPVDDNDAVTLLHLSVVGTVHDTPDLLTATLDGTASSADPAAAQRQLDGRMKAATDLAGGTKGVAWQVADYAVDQTDPGPGSSRTTWSAHQTLELHAADADAATLLGLVGRLQGTGLTVRSLQWELSPARRASAEQRATAQALTLLRDRAEAAATTLGLKVDTIRSITLGEIGHVQPMMRMMAAAPAPQATRSDAEISEEANSEIALKR